MPPLKRAYNFLKNFKIPLETFELPSYLRRSARSGRNPHLHNNAEFGRWTTQKRIVLRNSIFTQLEAQTTQVAHIVTAR
jgi:hypothetical protein